MDERDIAKDRDLARLALEAHKEDVIPDETHDFSATVVGLASMALHYISRTEHLERMVKAASDLVWLVLRCCPPVSPKTCRRNARDCEKCIRDYLDTKAKEGAKDA